MGRKDGHDYTGKVRDPIIQPNGKDTLFSGRAVSPPSILVRARAPSGISRSLLLSRSLLSFSRRLVAKPRFSPVNNKILNHRCILAR